MKKIISFLKKVIKSKTFICLVVLLVIFLILANWPSKPSEYDYGVTFSAKYTRELGLDPAEVFDAMTNDLGFKKLRLVAYWDQIEKQKDVYDFSDLDWQIRRAESAGAEVVLALGRRVPRWPECHFPEWIYGKAFETQQNELIDYIRAVVNRYKDSSAIKYWQVENEPFLTAYVPHICGRELDVNFLDREIDVVRRLDPTRKIITTDSGNTGMWLPAYKRGDIFGSTFYIYLANPEIGEVKSVLNHNYYKLKKFLATAFYGDKETWLIEVSLEPWLLEPIADTPIVDQLDAMSIDRIKEILLKSARTNFDEQYLWGVEWWYYLKVHGEKQGIPGGGEIWDFMRKVMEEGVDWIE